MRRGMKHLVCVMFLLLACQAGAFEIREISCNQMPEPIGVDCHQMQFSWKVESKERDYRQQAYQIEIRESTSGRVVWNSGRRESEESVLVPYGGETLKPATTYIYISRACVEYCREVVEMECIAAFHYGSSREERLAGCTLDCTGGRPRARGAGVSCHRCRLACLGRPGRR